MYWFEFTAVDALVVPASSSEGAAGSCCHLTGTQDKLRNSVLQQAPEIGETRLLLDSCMDFCMEEPILACSGTRRAEQHAKPWLPTGLQSL